MSLDLKIGLNETKSLCIGIRKNDDLWAIKMYCTTTDDPNTATNGNNAIESRIMRRVSEIKPKHFAKESRCLFFEEDMNTIQESTSSILNKCNIIENFNSETMEQLHLFLSDFISEMKAYKKHQQNVLNHDSFVTETSSGKEKECLYDLKPHRKHQHYTVKYITSPFALLKSDAKFLKYRDIIIRHPDALAQLMPKILIHYPGLIHFIRYHTSEFFKLLCEKL